MHRLSPCPFAFTLKRRPHGRRQIPTKASYTRASGGTEGGRGERESRASNRERDKRRRLRGGVVLTLASHPHAIAAAAEVVGRSEIGGWRARFLDGSAPLGGALIGGAASAGVSLAEAGQPRHGRTARREARRRGLRRPRQRPHLLCAVQPQAPNARRSRSSGQGRVSSIPIHRLLF